MTCLNLQMILFPITRQLPGEHALSQQNVGYKNELQNHFLHLAVERQSKRLGR